MIKRQHLLSVLVVLLVCSGLRAQDEESEVVSVDSSVVVINATITDSAGKPISGLKQPQFTVLEDGVEHPISFFTAEETPFAAVILLDTSGSMEERVTLARSAAIRFLDGLRADDNVSVYRFDSKVSLIQNFSNSRDISQGIFDIKSNGMTALNDAIASAAEVLEGRQERRRAIIVLSDGRDTFSKRSAAKALNAALAADAVIYTVDMSAVGTAGSERVQNQGVLRNFAEKTGGMFIRTPGGAAMRDAFRSIVEELGVQYTIGYHPMNTRKDGKWRNIELRVSRPNLRIRTRKGYNAEKAN